MSDSPSGTVTLPKPHTLLWEGSALMSWSPSFKRLGINMQRDGSCFLVASEGDHRITFMLSAEDARLIAGRLCAAPGSSSDEAAAQSAEVGS